MADGVQITAGSGTTVATDDAGASGHVQIVKLAISTDGSASLIPADTTRGMSVDPRRYFTDVAVDSAGLTNAAYSAGEVLGTGWTFANMARASGGRGVINGITVLDKNDLLTSIQLWFTSGSVTFGSDNASPSISDSDAEKIQPGSGIYVPLTDMGGVRIGAMDGLSIPYVCDATSLYVYATTPLALGSGWATATDVKVRLFAELI